MKVSINTPFARLALEMDESQAAKLMTEALIAAVPMHVNQVEDSEAFRAGEKAPPEEPAEVSVAPVGQNGYRGFLHIKCNRCHKEKSFHIKWPLDRHRCECGHMTELRDLSEIVGKCGCGWKMKYFTNQDADSFELKCPSCDEAVLVKWDFRNKRYERVK